MNYYILNNYKEQIDKYDFILLYSGNNDNSINEFQINSNFFYITKLDIPNLIFVYDINTKEIYLFYKFGNSIWDDNTTYLNNMKYYTNNINDISHFNIQNYKNKKILSLENNNEDFINFTENKFNINFTLLDIICNESRIIKNSNEISSIYKAVNLSSKAIKLILKNLHKFKYSYQIVNYFKFIVGSYGQSKLAYKPICTSGIDNRILHSNNYSKFLKKGELILLDISCKYNNYSSDITRTFPVNGKFTKLQSDIYNIVLAINIYCINNVSINKNWQILTDECYIKIYNGLNELKIVKKTDSNYHKKKIGQLFMPHSLGHNIGIDCHDPGNISILKKNMVITVEPGIYFYKEQLLNSYVNKNIWKKYHNIGGVRIEDVVLVRKKSINLSKILDKDIKNIEYYLNNI